MLTWLFDFSCWKKRVQIKLLFQVQLDKTVVVASNSHGQPVGECGSLGRSQYNK